MTCALPVQLGKTVAENLLSFDQRLWLRLATRSDSASSPEERQKCGLLLLLSFCSGPAGS